MTILIYFLQPFSCNPIVMEKSPHSSSLLLSMAFSRSNLQKQTWFQLTDTVPCQMSSWVSYKAEYQLKGRTGHSEKQICNDGEKGTIVGGLGGRWPSGRVPLWEDNDFLGYQQSSLQALSESLMRCDGFRRQYSPPPRIGSVLINYI